MEQCKDCKHFIKTGKSFDGNFEDGGMCVASDSTLGYAHTGCSACRLYEKSDGDQSFCDNLIYVCSPYSTGDVRYNTYIAQKLCRYVFDCGCIPVASHLYFPQFMDDSIPKERETAMRICKQLVGICKELWVFLVGECSNVTNGMNQEIERAKQLGLPIRYMHVPVADRQPKFDEILEVHI